MKFDTQEDIAAETGPLRALRFRGDEIVFRHGSRVLTARECVALVNRIVRVLQARGVHQGMALAVLSRNMPETYLTQLAVRHMGVRYTPLHPMGSLDDHLFVLDDAEIDVLVYDPRHFSVRAAELRESRPGLRLLSLGEDGDADDLLAAAAEQSSADVPPALVRGGDIESIFYTGGTTGRPKGVPHTVFGTSYTQSISAGAGDRPPGALPQKLLIATPISHAGGSQIGPMLMRGGSVVLTDGFDPEEFLRLVAEHRVTNAFLVPTMIYVLLDHLRDHPGTDVSSIEEFVYGAAPMSPTRLAEAIERFGQVFVQGYGQTEAGVGILRLGREDHRLDRPDLLASAGRPTPGVVAKILREDGTEADLGEVGELCLRGPMVMPGYWKRPDLTAHALRGGWLHTDDMGFMDEGGYVTLVDRRKDMIISGGFNVYPSEVEDAISELAEVSSCAVVGRPDEKWGESVTAYLVLREGASLTEETVIRHVRERKGPIQTPKTVHFIDELPVTQLGKLNKKALRTWPEA
ncbi:AMP-binding protein [Brevibacterium album]|uniref:AMP-binding protein n=1 Tax=Brevibacterium album TaxID=417948 RepID=UPI000414BE24|nr:AMP-binding protein [Brevibacterium album]